MRLKYGYCGEGYSGECEVCDELIMSLLPKGYKLVRASIDLFRGKNTAAIYLNAGNDSFVKTIKMSDITIVESQNDNQ
jgi:hypothetical protein